MGIGLGGLTSAFGGSSSESFVPGWQKKYLTDIYGQAQNIYGGLQPPDTALTQQAMQGLGSTIGGQYLPGGEAFQTQLEALGRSIMPQVDSRFAQSGRFGSGLHKIGLGQALADAGTNLFQQERARQMQATGMLPQMQQAQAALPWLGLQNYKNIIGSPIQLQKSQTAAGGLGDLAAGIGGFGLDMGWWGPK